jgi:hypothetical protein
VSVRSLRESTGSLRLKQTRPAYIRMVLLQGNSNGGIEHSGDVGAANWQEERLIFTCCNRAKQCFGMFFSRILSYRGCPGFAESVSRGKTRNS